MRKKSSLFWATLFLLAGFVGVLGSLNLYHYFRLKDQYALERLLTWSRPDLDRIKAGFEELEKQLLFIKDLGQNGLLKRDDLKTLNKKFFPFLKTQPLVGALILADDKGWEYLLYQKGELFVTRLTRLEAGGARQTFIKWKGPEEPLEEWEEKAPYDPRKRPWFRPPGEEIRWTKLYHFFLSGEEGLTASVSWSKKDGSGYMVLAIDLPASRLREFMAPSQRDFPGIFFLIDLKNQAFIPGRSSSLPAGEDLKVFLPKILKTWQGLKSPQAPFKVDLLGQSWVALISGPVVSGAPFQLGVVAPEEKLLEGLRQALFRFDPLDLAVSLLGGLFFLFLFWKLGALRRLEERSSDPFVRLLEYLKKGESSRVEFKSTVRLNLKTGKPGKEIELAWLKAVAAFLNSEGGVVLLGVDDSGKIVGVEQDGFENLDKLQLHLKNLINQHLGAEFSRYLEVTPVEVDGHTVIMIECRPSPEPVFLKMGKNEEFYIRSGPSSVKLSPSQTVAYVLQGKKKGR